MRKLNAMMLAVALTMSGTLALADEPTIEVEGAWARASIGVSRPGAAYLTLRNTGEETETLTGLQTDLAMMSEFHRTTTDDQGVSSMSPAGDIEIPPGESVLIQPDGGMHAMLMRLTRPMIEGETFSVTLLFADGDELAFDVPIYGIASRGPQTE